MARRALADPLAIARQSRKAERGGGRRGFLSRGPPFCESLAAVALAARHNGVGLALASRIARLLTKRRWAVGLIALDCA